MAREPFERIWTESPTAPDFDEPTNDMWEEGWRGGADQDPPEAYAQNWWQNRADIALQQIERQGAMEWLSGVPYVKGARAYGSNGELYIAVQDNQGVNPTTDSGQNWKTLTQIILDLLNVSGQAPVFGVRAWVNFDGKGGAVVKASGNVSSVVRNSAGDYTVFFSENMPSKNYSVSGSVGSLANGDVIGLNYEPEVDSFRFQTRTATGDAQDKNRIHLHFVV